MLAITNDGRKAALDMRLVDASAANETDSKIATCANNVHRIWQESAANLGTQAVFCDLSTPRNDGSFSAYNDLRDKLMLRGIPADQIAFIHDYDSDAAKETLFSAVRDGVVRVVLGSTAKMGVGTNIQNRLIALHHLDAPWRPSDVEQREGRIVRQGNQNAAVAIYRYATESSFDAYIWQCLESKLRFVTQIMQGNNGIRSAEDIELAALSYAEVKALASGNPMVLEKTAIDTELAKLSILKTQWGQQIWRNKQELATMPSRIDQIGNRVENLNRDLAKMQQTSAQSAIIQGIVCRDENEMALAIAKVTRGQRNFGEKITLGSIGHFSIVMESLVNARTYTLRGNADINVGMVTSNAEAARKLFTLATTGSVAHMVSEAEDHRQRTITRRDAIQAEVIKPFDKQDRFEQLQVRQREIEQALDLSKGDIGAIDEDLKEAA